MSEVAVVLSFICELAIGRCYMWQVYTFGHRPSGIPT